MLKKIIRKSLDFYIKNKYSRYFLLYILHNFVPTYLNFYKKKILSYINYSFQNHKFLQVQKNNKKNSKILGSEIIKFFIIDKIKKNNLKNFFNTEDVINFNSFLFQSKPELKTAINFLEKNINKGHILNIKNNKYENGLNINNSIYEILTQINFFSSNQLNRNILLSHNNFDVYCKSMIVIFIFPFLFKEQILIFKNKFNNKEYYKIISDFMYEENIEILSNYYDHLSRTFTEFQRNLIIDYQKYLLSKKIFNNQNSEKIKNNYFVDKTLSENGYESLGVPFNNNQINEIHKYFKSIKVYNSHIKAFSDQKPREWDKSRDFGAYGSYSLLDTINCPFLIEFALNDKIIEKVSYILGGTPCIYSMNTWWTYKASNNHKAFTHNFHRDQDDSNFVALFIYLSDIINNDDGGVEYAVGSHSTKQASIKKLLDINTDNTFQHKIKDGYTSNKKFNYQNIFDIKYLNGKSGSAFIASTYGLHRGTPTIKNDRLACWIRYSLIKPCTYKLDKLKPINYRLFNKSRINLTEKNKFIIRHLFDF